MSESIGARIARLRGSMKIGDFAECLGVNRKTITRWEADETLPDGSSLLALHQRFGASPTWVLLGDIDPGAREVSLAAEETLLLERYRQSPAALRDAALRVLLGGSSQQSTIQESAPSVGKIGGSGHRFSIKGDYYEQGKPKK